MKSHLKLVILVQFLVLSAFVQAQECSSVSDIAKLLDAASELNTTVVSMRASGGNAGSADALRYLSDRVQGASESEALSEQLASPAAEWLGSVSRVADGVMSHAQVVAAHQSLETQAPLLQVQISEELSRQATEGADVMKVYYLATSLTLVERMLRRGGEVVDLGIGSIVAAEGLQRDATMLGNILGALESGNAEWDIKPPTEAKKQVFAQLAGLAQGIIDSADQMAESGTTLKAFASALQNAELQYLEFKSRALTALRIAADDCLHGGY